MISSTYFEQYFNIFLFRPLT